MIKKLEKFERLAEKRVSDAIRKLRLIGNLSNKNNYSYTEDHVKQLLDALETEMRILKGRFREESAAKAASFSFKTKKNDRGKQED